MNPRLPKPTAIHTISTQNQMRVAVYSENQDNDTVEMLKRKEKELMIVSQEITGLREG